MLPEASDGVLAVEEGVEAHLDPRRELRQPLERQQHAGDERLARIGVVTDRKELAFPAEEHLLVGDEAGETDGVDHGLTREAVGGCLRRPRRCVELRLVMELDDLGAREIAPRLGREAAS